MKISDNILNNTHHQNATRKTLIDCQERLQALIQRVRAMQGSHHLRFDDKNNIADQIRNTAIRGLDFNIAFCADNFCIDGFLQKFFTAKIGEFIQKSIVITSKLPSFRALSALLNMWKNNWIKFVDTKT